MRWFHIDPCYVVANAHDSRNAIVLQVVRYPELWRDSGGFEVDAAVWNWTSDLDTGVMESQLGDRAVEFPRIDDRPAGWYLTYAYDSAPRRVAHGFHGNRIPD